MTNENITATESALATDFIKSHIECVVRRFLHDTSVYDMEHELHTLLYDIHVQNNEKVSQLNSIITSLQNDNARTHT